MSENVKVPYNTSQMRWTPTGEIQFDSDGRAFVMATPLSETESPLDPEFAASVDEMASATSRYYRTLIAGSVPFELASELTRAWHDYQWNRILASEDA